MGFLGLLRGAAAVVYDAFIHRLDMELDDLSRAAFGIHDRMICHSSHL